MIVKKMTLTKIMVSQDPWISFVQGILRKQNNKIIIQVLEKILWSEFAKARQLPTHHHNSRAGEVSTSKVTSCYLMRFTS
jgi:hypothetical protein